MAKKRKKQGKKGYYVLHSRRPPGQELQEIRQARLILDDNVFSSLSCVITGQAEQACRYFF